MTKARIGMSPNLLPILGKNLYSRYSVSLVRELLQNSRDACLRANVDPDISITIRANNYKAEITCEDNGIGMSDLDMAQVYAVIGETSKHEDYETGGLGIGATTVLIADDYYVESRKWRMSRDSLLNNSEFEDIPERIGTKIWVKSEQAFYRSTFSQIYLLIHLSDVRVHLTYIIGDNVEFDDVVGSANLQPKAEEQFDNFRFWMTDCIDVPLHGNYNGVSVVRMNGLVQFIEVASHRPTYLWFELAPKRPGEDDWPLTLSRESLNREANELFRKTVTTHNVDFITSEQILKKEQEINKVIDGYLIAGQRNRSSYEMDIFTEPTPQGYCFEGSLDGNYEFVEAVDAEPSVSGTYKITLADGRIVCAASTDVVGQLPAWMNQEGVMVVDNIEQVITEVKKIPNRIAMYLTDYYPPTDVGKVKNYAKALRAWRAVLQIVCDSNERFGIGATTSQFVTADRVQDNQICYYILNPESIDLVRSPEAKVLALWHMACHNAAHYEQYTHDERHALLVTSIARATADNIMAFMPDIKKILK